MHGSELVQLKASNFRVEDRNARHQYGPDDVRRRAHVAHKVMLWAGQLVNVCMMIRGADAV